MLRSNVLSNANDCITKDRTATHGKPENSFLNIAKLWSIYKDHEFTPQDVAVMMALMKIARIKSNEKHLDNYVDGCGYLALAAELANNT